jgi:hypothetical protein
MPNKYPQTNIRFTPEDKDRIQRIAMRLHKQGVPGVLDSSYKAIVTEVIRYLVREKDREQTEEENTKDS